MRIMLSLLLSMAVACAVAEEGARGSNSNIDAITQEWLASTGAPSVSIAIVKNGVMTYAHAYGQARLEPQMLATTATRYAIDSVSKEFTAAAVLFLVQQVSEELIVGGLTRDASLLPAGEIEMLLRGTESLVVAAASGDVDLDRLAEITGVRPLERDADWLQVDRSWIQLSAARRLVADALPAPVAAFAAGNRDDRALVAYLAASGGIATPGQAHEACMKVLREPDHAGRARNTAIAPSRYVICAGPPDDPDDLASWQRQPVIAAGDGCDPAPPGGQQGPTTNGQQGATTNGR